MQYELRHARNPVEAGQIIDEALRVLAGQIEYYRGQRKRPWNGEFVDHALNEARVAVEYLRHPERH